MCIVAEAAESGTKDAYIYYMAVCVCVCSGGLRDSCVGGLHAIYVASDSVNVITRQSLMHMLGAGTHFKCY